MFRPSLLSLAVACCALPGWARAEDTFFDSNGVKIRYVTAGEGEAVVLLHGWMSDSSMWGRDAAGNTKLKTAGVEGFRFIAMDSRGHGKSDKPHDTQQYGAEMAEDVIRLLDHLKIKRAHLVGYSMGAFIAGNVAANHPHRVISVLYGGQAPLIQGQDNTSSEIEAFGKAVDEGKGLGPYLIAVTPSDKPKMTPEQADALAKYLYNGKDVQAFAAAGRSFPALAVSETNLRRFQGPVLFLHGANESASVKNRVATIQKLQGHGEIKLVPGGDHVTTLLKPEFRKWLIEFLRQNQGK